MNNMNTPLGVILLSSILADAARQGHSGIPNLDEMLGGRQKGKRVFSWSDAGEAEKIRARHAIADGNLAPNCDSPDCEFCNWIREQPEWMVRNGSSPEPDQRFKQEYGEGVAANQKSVPGILREAAETYEQRNPLYGDAYKHYGAAMMAFFPQGLYINEPDDWNRFGLFSMMVSKMNRIASNLAAGGHYDSALDLSVYAAMMAELTEQK